MRCTPTSPRKRALYFAVLADLAEPPHPEPPHPEPPHPEPGRTAPEALGALARAWVGGLPRVGADTVHGRPRLGRHRMSEVLSEERIRRPFAQLMKLDAILLGLALEGLRPPDAPPGRLVRTAEAVLTACTVRASWPTPRRVSSSRSTSSAPANGSPVWTSTTTGPRRTFPASRAPARPTSRGPRRPRWTPCAAGRRGRPATPVVAILGLHRLEAAEEAVRAAPPGATVTAVLVTGEPAELMPPARLAVAGLCGCLRPAFPPSAWPRLQVVYDASGALARAAGVPAVSDGTEAAVRIEAGRIVARADGRGAGHAAAAAEGAAPASETRRDGSRLS